MLSNASIPKSQHPEHADSCDWDEDVEKGYKILEQIYYTSSKIGEKGWKNLQIALVEDYDLPCDAAWEAVNQFRHIRGKK